jgi:hypothetical protein
MFTDGYIAAIRKIANCVFTYSTLLSMFVKNDKNVALALKGLKSV